jgi:hypothetical protein
MSGVGIGTIISGGGFRYSIKKVTNVDSDFTIEGNDYGTYFRHTGAVGIDVTIDNSLPIRSSVVFRQAGLGFINLINDGVVLNGTGFLDEQHSTMAIVKVADGVYDVIIYNEAGGAGASLWQEDSPTTIRPVGGKKVDVSHIDGINASELDRWVSESRLADILADTDVLLPFSYDVGESQLDVFIGNNILIYGVDWVESDANNIQFKFDVDKDWTIVVRKFSSIVEVDVFGRPLPLDYTPVNSPIEAGDTIQTALEKAQGQLDAGANVIIDFVSTIEESTFDIDLVDNYRQIRVDVKLIEQDDAGGSLGLDVRVNNVSTANSYALLTTTADRYVFNKGTHNCANLTMLLHSNDGYIGGFASFQRFTAADTTAGANRNLTSKYNVGWLGGINRITIIAGNNVKVGSRITITGLKV